MAFGINIYECQSHPRHGPLSVKQLKNDSYYYIKNSKYLLQVFKEINKQGDSNKEFSWENVFEKSKKNSMPIRDISGSCTGASAPAISKILGYLAPAIF